MTLVMQSAKTFDQGVSNDAITSTPCANNRTSTSLRSGNTSCNSIGSYNFRTNRSSVSKEYNDIIKPIGPQKKSSGNTPNLSISVQKRKLFSKISAMGIKSAKKMKISTDNASVVESKNDKNKKNGKEKNVEAIVDKNPILNTVEISQSLNKKVNSKSTIEYNADCFALIKNDELKELPTNCTNVTDSNNRMSGGSFNNQFSSKPSFIKRKLHSNVCDYTDQDSAKSFDTSFLKKNSIINIYDQGHSKRESNGKIKVPDSNIKSNDTKKKDSMVNEQLKRAYTLRNKSDKNTTTNANENIINKTINFKTIPKESTCNYIAHLLKDISNDAEKSVVPENVSEINRMVLDESEKMFDFNESVNVTVKESKKTSTKKSETRTTRSSLSKSKEMVKKDVLKNVKGTKTKPAVVKVSKPVKKVSTVSKKMNDSADKKSKTVAVKDNKRKSLPKVTKNKTNTKKSGKSSEKENVENEENFIQEIVKKWENTFDEIDRDEMSVKYNQRNISYFNSKQPKIGSYADRNQYSDFKSNARAIRSISDDRTSHDDRGNFELSSFDKYLKPYSNNRADDEDRFPERRIVPTSYFKNSLRSRMEDSQMWKVSVHDESYRNTTQMFNEELFKEIKREQAPRKAISNMRRNDDTFKVPIGYPKRKINDNQIVYEHRSRIDMFTERDRNDDFDRRYDLYSDNYQNDDISRISRRYDNHANRNIGISDNRSRSHLDFDRDNGNRNRNIDNYGDEFSRRYDNHANNRNNAIGNNRSHLRLDFDRYNDNRNRNIDHYDDELNRRYDNHTNNRNIGDRSRSHLDFDRCNDNRNRNIDHYDDEFNRRYDNHTNNRNIGDRSRSHLDFDRCNDNRNRNIDTYRGIDSDNDIRRRCDISQSTHILNSMDRPLRLENRIPNNQYLRNNSQFAFQTDAFDDQIQSGYNMRGVPNSNQMIKTSRYNEHVDVIEDSIHNYGRLQEHSTAINNGVITHKKIETVTSKTILAPVDAACSSKINTMISGPEITEIEVDESVPIIPQSDYVQFKSLKSIDIPGRSEDNENASKVISTNNENVFKMPKTNGLKILHFDDPADSLIIDKNGRPHLAATFNNFDDEVLSSSPPKIFQGPSTDLILNAEPPYSALDDVEDNLPESDDDSLIVLNKQPKNYSPWRFKY